MALIVYQIGYTLNYCKVYEISRWFFWSLVLLGPFSCYLFCFSGWLLVRRHVSSVAAIHFHLKFTFVPLSSKQKWENMYCMYYNYWITNSVTSVDIWSIETLSKLKTFLAQWHHISFRNVTINVFKCQGLVPDIQLTILLGIHFQIKLYNAFCYWSIIFENKCYPHHVTVSKCVFCLR